MAGMSEEQKDGVRRQLESQLANQSIPEDLKQKIRQNLETKLLESDVAYADKEVDTFGAEKWDDAVQRYRDLGARTRAPVALDQRQADQARGLQIGALGTLESAAQGNAPSTAAIQGQLQREQIAGGAVAGMGAARGVGGQVAAARGLGGAMGNQLVGSLAGTTMARANEANQDRNAFAGATQGVRQQDIGAATTNAELMAKSRAQDEARQQGFEKMGWATRNAQMGANTEVRRQTDAKRVEIAQQKAAQANRESAAGKTAASVGSALLMSASMFSDERTKYELDMGALSRIGRR